MAECRRVSNARHRFCLSRYAVGLALLYVVFVPGRVHAQLLQRPLAIENARILTMDATVIENGTLLVKGQKIVALSRNVKLPLLTKRIDAQGGTLTPGLIDVYCPWGQSSGSASATRRAEDAFDHYDTANLVETLRGGVTAVYLSPGNASGIGGSGAIMRLALRNGSDEALGTLLAGKAALCINLASESKPISRLKTLASIRKQFDGALEYRRSLEDYEEDLAEYEKQLKEWVARREKEKKKAKPKDESGNGKKPAQSTTAAEEPKKETEKKTSEKEDDSKKGDDDGKPKKPKHPGRKPQFDVVLRALDRDMPVRIVAHRSEDILNALELAEEFSFDLILEGAAEAHLLAEELAEANVLVVFGSLARDSIPRDDVFRRFVPDATTVLSRRGVPWIVGSGPGGTASPRFLALNSQLAAARDGDVDPLVGITAKAADALGVADRIGRLRPGLLADFVLWSGDPLDPAAKVRATYVGGAPVYEAAEKPEKGGAK